jgi:DNA (cytosine-5)-methyltransferase 1
MPTFGSLFSGIGGLDLGLERAGWTCRWQVENDPFCQRVLARHWPDVARYGDIVALDPERLAPVDLVCGGFPCQPVSVAGKRLAQADARWLWPEFSRVVRALRPRLVLLENVPGLLHADDGRAMGQVLGDLAASGYDAEWDCVGAADVGAPHQRARVWIIAHAQGHLRGAPGHEGPEASDGSSASLANTVPDRNGALKQGHTSIRKPIGCGTKVADPQELRLEGRAISDIPDGATSGNGRSESLRSGGRVAAFADPEGQRLSRGVPHAWCFGPRVPGPKQVDWWRTEPDVGRVAHGVPARVERLRGLGNAVVPQVAEWIGRRLLSP